MYGIGISEQRVIRTETAQLFGLFLVASLQNAALKRHALPRRVSPHRNKNLL